MKRQIIITIVLLLATAFITVVYFKNLSPPGMRTSQVMRNIPDDAALIFEFNNEKSFYDIFNGNKLFTAVIGKQKLDDLDTLRNELLLNSSIERYFTGQNIFISIHPSKTNTIDMLLTMSSENGFEPSMFDELNKQKNSGLVVTPLRSGNQQGYSIFVNKLKKRFYVISKEDNIFLGSFSKELINQSVVYKIKSDRQAFVLLSDRQNNNSLANLYINCSKLSSLFDQLFANKNTDIFKSFRLLPGLTALSMNYRSDALMFNGSTIIQHNQPASYLNLFAYQQPVANHLKDIFPSTTAYCINFAVSDPAKFAVDLEKQYTQAGLKPEKDLVFNKIRAETGISLKRDFTNLLGNEFAVVTTRYFEKLALISVKDGSKLKTLMTGISKMSDENSGQLNYDKLPFLLLGDAFSLFKRPYFIIVDNYLILANSTGELTSYYDSYINRKFLNKNSQYNKFDELVAGRSNVNFFFNFKNSEPILKRDFAPDIYDSFLNNEQGWKSFYAASWQFTASDNNFYTNFCMRVNADTTTIKN